MWDSQRTPIRETFYKSKIKEFTPKRIAFQRGAKTHSSFMDRKRTAVLVQNSTYHITFNVQYILSIIIAFCLKKYSKLHWPLGNERWDESQPTPNRFNILKRQITYYVSIHNQEKAESWNFATIQSTSCYFCSCPK